ncbi:MAG: OmpA family protein [Bacteroidota bacterium]
MRKIILTVLVVALFQIVVFAQESIRKELFGESDEMIQKIEEQKGDIYAPNTYKSGMEAYNDAEEKFKDGGNMEDIKEYIDEANVSFKKVFEFIDLANLSFPTTIKAREDAITAESEKHASGLWKGAEEKFKEAMSDMEDNDLSSAKSTAAEAEKMYRETELAAIEQGILVNAREQIKKNDENDVPDFAPTTQALAKKHIETAEKLLTGDRYKRDEAKKNAIEAEYQANHAEYIANLAKKVQEMDDGYEYLILESEKPLLSLNDKIGKVARFDKGYDSATKNLEDYIASVDELKATIEDQKKQIAQLESKMTAYSETESKLQRKMDQEAKIKAIEKTFTKSEAQVLQDGDNVIIRLYGLTFPSGESTIKPEYFGLLKKVQNGIETFDNCNVAVQGHTDSRGSNDLNMKLSEERAAAVKEYLTANEPSLKSRITSQGYGKERPIASNETEEGRAKNRRIDIVITPEWAK